MRTAGIFRRFLGDVVDGIILFLFSCILVLALDFSVPSTLGTDLLQAVQGLVLLPIPLLYYALFESSKAQATLGERLMGLRIYSKTYERLSFWHAVGRYASGWLSQLVLIILWVLGSVVLLTMVASGSVVFWAAVVGAVLSFIWWLCTFYIRIFSHRQQTFRDFLSRSLVIVEKK